ncbi:MAG TPA: HEAT repeat domain-containing protein [Nitrospirota bacterium]|nr:HEAT repeat domain-containing protein [Nitrospirota bacterium]
MRNLISAIRAVKLYPPNNPIYSQSVAKAHESLVRFFSAEPDYRMSVQKTAFAYRKTAALGKDAQLNKAIAQDLYGKGIREIVFLAGMTENELMTMCKALALPPEELAMKSGISSILWEKDAKHIKVTEAGLDEVIATKSEEAWKPQDRAGRESTEEKKPEFEGRTLVLGGLLDDPTGFGARMLELAKQTKSEQETVEERLYSLYQEAGRKIEQENPDQTDTMFEGLAKSVLSLDPQFRDSLVAGKLYGELDAEMAGEANLNPDLQLPSELHEIQSSRFSSAWTVEQVAVLLKKSASRKIVSPPAKSLAERLKAAPIARDLASVAQELATYGAEEMNALKALAETGMESDIIDATVRTLLYLLKVVKNPWLNRPTEKDAQLFSGVVHQLEDMVSFTLAKKNYELATDIVHKLQDIKDPVFAQRIADTVKKTSSKSVVTAAVRELRKYTKDAPEYQIAHAYLSSMEKQTTKVLLELLAEENDRASRIFLLDLVKDFGKNHVGLLGEHLSDSRWYFVRNVVCILGDNKSDQSLALLRKAADHENIKIRQEVIKGLISIGGKKAASVMVKFLRDKDPDVQLTAIRAYGDFPGMGSEEAVPVMNFLENRILGKKEQDLTVEAIRTLGKIGSREASEFLKKYLKISWWKSRKLQRGLRDAAASALEDIARRKSDGGTAKR